MRKYPIASVITGNMLEFYDFNLVLIYGTILAQTFFPEGDSFLSTIYRMMGVYVLGVIARPLGALLFSHIGDRYGRKRALYLSMFLMAIPSAIITVLPDYQTIGIMAPIALIVVRIIQGICTGGEYNGVAIYALESTKNHQGLISGIVSGSSISGVVLASAVQLVLQFSVISVMGWRFAFLIGTGIALFGVYVRSQLLESPEFLNQNTVQKANYPLWQVFKQYKKEMMLTFLVSGQLAVFGYLLLVGAPSLLRLNPAFDCHYLPYFTITSALLWVVGCVLLGALSDRKGHQTIFIRLASAVSVVTLPFVFWALKSTYIPAIIAAYVILALLAALMGSVQHRFYQSLFPVHLRYSGIAVSFWLGAGIISLLVPVWITTPSAPWLYPIIYTVFTGLFVWRYEKQKVLSKQAA